MIPIFRYFPNSFMNPALGTIAIDMSIMGICYYGFAQAGT
jgi:hypothetical protein